jgi:circadian clock protein KaiC
VLQGLEGHLATIHQQVKEFQPRLLIIDPISDLTAVGSLRDAKAMMTRLIDFLKSRQITAVLLNLQQGGAAAELTEIGISSLVDTWLLLRDIESGGERNRGLYVLKSRGAAHSNQIREFLLTPRGIELRPAYIGADGAFTGTARLAQEARDRASEAESREEAERLRRRQAQQRRLLDARIAALRLEAEYAEAEARHASERQEATQQRSRSVRQATAESRRILTSPVATGKGRRAARKVN